MGGYHLNRIQLIPKNTEKMKTSITTHITPLLASPRSLRFIAGLFLFLFASCTSLVPDEPLLDTQLHQVNVNFTSFDFTTTPMTRAGESTTIPENLNRISISVFSSSAAEAVVTLTQSRESLGEGETFGNISFTLPLGTYTLVAVVHEAKEATETTAAEPAVTINSPSLVTLPSKSIRDTYAKVQTFTVIRDGASVSLSMGKRINAAFRLETTDNVPEGVSSLYIVTASDGAVKLPNNPTFNPSTGFATAAWNYDINLSSTPGAPFDRSISLLLPSDELITDITIDAYNGTSKLQAYGLTLPNVKLQRAYITHAKGTFFTANGTGSPSFTFNTEQGTYDVSF